MNKVSRSTDTATKVETGLSEILQGETIDGMIDDNNGRDFEGLAVSDIAIPFLKILQDLSPQVKSGPTQLEGAKAGMLYNSTTERMWANGVDFIPCALKKVYVEWIPRTAGGGFVAAHETMEKYDTAVRVDRAFMLPNGNEIIPTVLHYGLLCPVNEIPLPVVLAFNRTQLKKSRQWISIMSMQVIRTKSGIKRPRIYSYFYKLSTILESKDNYTWYGWNVSKTPILINSSEVFKSAKDFAKLVNGGNIQTKFEEEIEQEDTVSSEIM